MKIFYHCNMYCSRILLLIILFHFSNEIRAQVITGAEQFELYVPVLKGKKIALVVNQTSMVKSSHLVDTLLKMGVKITCIFAPEHGFRGNASAGTLVSSGKDEKTGIKIISLYGNHKKPTKEDLSGIDHILFDIQDVGVRFYTYISTMHYVMEASAQNKIPFTVLDRPNPNGHYFDGPLLDTNFRSFVGMHPVPLVHGCTVGEFAQMINGEFWLGKDIKCELSVVKCRNYDHNTEYVLPVKPSPNLQTQSAIYLYPSLGLFEGTIIPMGQGTDRPYQCFGSPAFDWGNFNFTPVSIKGVSEKPKSLGIPCIGFDLSWYGFNRAHKAAELNINWLIISYKLSKNKPLFFNDFFEKLAGNGILRKQIQDGRTAFEIRETWQAGLEKYKLIRSKYLLYP